MGNFDSAEFNYGTRSIGPWPFQIAGEENIKVTDEDPFGEALKTAQSEYTRVEEYLSSSAHIKVWNMNNDVHVTEYEELKGRALRDQLNTKGADARHKVCILREETNWDKLGNYMVAVTWSEIIDESPEEDEPEGESISE